MVNKAPHQLPGRNTQISTRLNVKVRLFATGSLFLWHSGLRTCLLSQGYSMYFQSSCEAAQLTHRVIYPQKIFTKMAFAVCRGSAPSHRTVFKARSGWALTHIGQTPSAQGWRAEFYSWLRSCTCKRPFPVFTYIAVRRGSAEVGIPFHVWEQLNKAFASAHATVRLNNFGPFQEPVFFPNAPQKGFRFEVGVQGSRRRPKFVFAFVSASVRKRLQASASVPKHPRAFASFASVRKRSQAFAECWEWLGVENRRKNRREAQSCHHFLLLAPQSLNSHR